VEVWPNGPFSKIVVYLQLKWNGTPVGKPTLARFI
jgi:hypothetical protein